MADPNRQTPGTSPRGRGRSKRKQRRRRFALLGLLLASFVGAAVFAPDLVQFARNGRPSLHRQQRPVRIARPVVRHQWRFDFSMGPILERIEQGLNLEPFDLRRPLRIPFTIRSRPAPTDILLFGPAGYTPPLLPSYATGVGSLPGSKPFNLPDFPFFGPGFAPGGPNGQPDFDPDLVDGDDPLAPPGEKPKKKKKPKKPKKDVPEPGVALMAMSALGALALLRRRSSIHRQD
jgi:MYXO-CTERM domain-containing protein